MAEALILEFKGGTAEIYHAVNKILNIDPVTGAGDWPAGMQSHTGVVGAPDELLVFEVWESKAAQEDFMANRLGPALGQVGMVAPHRQEWFSVEGHHSH
jgi:hypothetical protein